VLQAGNANGYDKLDRQAGTAGTHHRHIDAVVSRHHRQAPQAGATSRCTAGRHRRQAPWQVPRTASNCRNQVTLLLAQKRSIDTALQADKHTGIAARQEAGRHRDTTARHRK